VRQGFSDFFDNDERGPDEDLKLEFEALSQFDPEVRRLLERSYRAWSCSTNPNVDQCRQRLNQGNDGVSTMQNAKDAARQIIDHLPEQATWDDIMYELYVKQKIETGLKAADEGRMVSHQEAKKRLLGNAD